MLVTAHPLISDQRSLYLAANWPSGCHYEAGVWSLPWLWLALWPFTVTSNHYIGMRVSLWEVLLCLVRVSSPLMSVWTPKIRVVFPPLFSGMCPLSSIPFSIFLGSHIACFCFLHRTFCFHIFWRCIGRCSFCAAEVMWLLFLYWNNFNGLCSCFTLSFSASAKDRRKLIHLMCEIKSQ